MSNVINKKAEYNVIRLKIDRYESKIQAMREDIDTFGGCPEDYQKIREWEKEIQTLKALLPDSTQDA